MARAKILPLPDHQVRHILSHMDELTATFPAGGSTRPFLASFIQLVYEATGRVFGASTVRKLLQLYAEDYKPSTNTIQKELELFKKMGGAVPVTSVEASEPEIPTSPNPTYKTADDNRLPMLIAGLQRAIETLPQTTAANGDQQQILAQAFDAENQRLRHQIERLSNVLENNNKELEKARTALDSALTERDTYQNLNAELLERLESLTDAVRMSDEQTAASHRFALGRVEESRAEIRRYQDELAHTKKVISDLKKQLEAEQSMTDALRRTLSTFRAQQAS